jgi:hypothetical protein
MFDPPITSPLSYIGVVTLLFGVFLLLAGLDVIRVKQVTVVRGRRTWVLGVLFSKVGLLILLPDIRHHFPARATAPTEASPGEESPTAEDAIPIAPSEAVLTSSEQPNADEVPAGPTWTPTRIQTAIQVNTLPTPYMPDGPRCGESCTPTGSAACIRIAPMDPWSLTTPVPYIDLDITSHETGQVWFHGNTGSEGAIWLGLPIEPHRFDITLGDYADESRCSFIGLSLPTIGWVSIWLQPSTPRGSSTCNLGSW